MREFLVDLNGTAAAKRAGYSEKTAYAIANENLNKLEIKKAVSEGLRERFSRIDLTAERILLELFRVATVDLSDAYLENGKLKPMREIPEDVRRAISGVEVFEEYEGGGENRAYVGDTVKVRFFDKTRALEMLAKYFKLLTEKHEHAGKDGGPIEIKAELKASIEDRIRQIKGEK